MVPLASLWLPIAISAVVVFLVSSLIHMVLGYHQNDFRRVPAEDEAMEALRRFNLAPGDYAMPLPASPRQMQAPEYVARRDKGPVLVMTIWPSGPPAMGASLALWFVYCLVVGLFAGYVAAITLAPGTPYTTVFRVTGTVAFVGYALALWQNTIWYKRAWSSTLKSTVDGLIYALVTAGVFGWLWPR